MRLALFGTIAAIACGVAILDHYDKNTNFQPVEARINVINEQCYMEKSERGVLTRTTTTSDLLRCDQAEQLTRQHPKWQGYAIHHKIEVRFAYVSPVDRARHESSLMISTFPNGQPLRAGDTLRVLASKTQADKTRSL